MNLFLVCRGGRVLESSAPPGVEQVWVHSSVCVCVCVPCLSICLYVLLQATDLAHEAVEKEEWLKTSEAKGPGKGKG